MDKWEYYVYVMRRGLLGGYDKNVIKEINSLGLVGWEAVSSSVDSEGNLCCLLKRKLP